MGKAIAMERVKGVKDVEWGIGMGRQCPNYIVPNQVESPSVGESHIAEMEGDKISYISRS